MHLLVSTFATAALSLYLVLSPPIAGGAQPGLPDLPPAVCKTLTDEFSRLASRDEAQLGALLNRVAWAHRAEGFGLSRKDFGNHTESPAGPIAVDILHRRSDNLLWDVIVDAGSPTSRPSCGQSIGPPPASNRPWVAPVDPGHTEPPPPPPPTCEACERERAALLQDVAGKQARIVDLELEVDSLRARALGAEQERDAARAAIGPLEAKIRELEARRCSFEWKSFGCRLK